MNNNDFGKHIHSDILSARVCDNSDRYLHMVDDVRPGFNGLASLIHSDMGKNIFSKAGMNYEGVKTSSGSGPCYDKGTNVRHGAMQIERIDDTACMLSQPGRQACGFDVEIQFNIHGHYIDQTITTCPNQDETFSLHFFASYMNQPQNTSIYMPEAGGDGPWGRFIEMTSPGHPFKGDSSVYTRPVDLSAATWDSLLTDNPVKRQKRIRDEESIRATEAAGFVKTDDRPLPTPFFFGLIDNYVALFIFKENVFKPWISASGAAATRNPAWDYEIFEDAQSVNEAKSYHVRLALKPFAGLQDILTEVAAFRGA